MNILLWTLQILLALWNIIGGIYMVNNYQEIASNWALNALPQPVWIILGVLQILFSLGLVLPGIRGISHKFIPISAAGLVVISLLGDVLYLSYTGFPGLLWGLIPAILAAFVTYKRWLTDGKLF